MSSNVMRMNTVGSLARCLNTYAGRPQIIDDHDIELAEEAAWVAIVAADGEGVARLDLRAGRFCRPRFVVTPRPPVRPQ
jgi:hypothetical protein